MLVKVDRMSMAHSLETRTPFLDPRLIEFMTGVHKNIKMKGYERKTVLRNTIGKQLPLSLLHAPKKGFAVPLREWFKDGSFENRLDSILNGFDQRQRAVLQEVIRDNRIGARDYGNFIWMLFALQKVNADGQG
jgi:asparagine synthase (glutamine-hydrolysing)